MIDDLYRTEAPQDEAPIGPRWPAIAGLRLAIRHACSRRGLAIAWRAACVAVAFLLMPLSMAVHGLRTLGGACPKRTDAAAVAARAWDLDDSAQPLLVLAAIMSSIAFVVVTLMLVCGVAR